MVLQLEGVQIKKDEKTFFWSGRYHMDMNTRDTLETQLNVLENFTPVVPDSYQDCEFLMLGNLVPAVQRSVIQQMKKRPKLIVMDTMNFWMEIALDDLKDVLTMVDVLMVNDSEARELSHEYSLVKAANKILTMGPKYLIIKKGEHGAFFFMKTMCFLHLPYRWKMYLTQPVQAILLPEALLVTLQKPKTFRSTI